MSKIDGLLKAYEKFVSLPWQVGLSDREKVWFCIYEPRDERRLRRRLDEFEMTTKNSGHKWVLVDVTRSFEKWMCENEYRYAYFAEPEYLMLPPDEFVSGLASQLGEQLQATDSNTVMAVLGVGTLVGVARLSEVLQEIQSSVPGRLMVFFPGTRSNNNYRLLDARDGWNYLAVPIEAEVKE